MRIQPTTEKYNSFGILTKLPVKKVYYPNCWNEVTEGSYKDYSFKVFNNYINKQKCSTLIIMKKADKWIKSKLKYLEEGKIKALWSYAKGEK